MISASPSPASDRKEPPEVGCVSPQVFRVRYRTSVIGRRPADWLMRWLSGDDIRVTITCFRSERAARGRMRIAAGLPRPLPHQRDRQAAGRLADALAIGR